MTTRTYGTSLTGSVLHTMTGPETAEALCGTTLYSLDVEPIDGDRYCKRCQNMIEYDVEKTLTDAGHNTRGTAGCGAVVDPSPNERDVIVHAYYTGFINDAVEQHIKACARTLTDAGYHVENHTYYLTVRLAPPEPDAAAAAEKVLTDAGHTKLDFIGQKAGEENGFRVELHPTEPGTVHVNAYHEGSYTSLKTRAHTDLYAADLKHAGWTILTIQQDESDHLMRNRHPYRLTARRPKGRPLYVVVSRHIDGQETEHPTDNLEYARLKAQTITGTPKWGASIEVRYPDGSIGRTA